MCLQHIKDGLIFHGRFKTMEYHQAQRLPSVDILLIITDMRLDHAQRNAWTVPT